MDWEIFIQDGISVDRQESITLDQARGDGILESMMIVESNRYGQIWERVRR